MRKHSSTSQGFTIMELLVVLAIVGILSAVVITGMADSRAEGRMAAAMQTMKGVHAAAMICVNTYTGAANPLSCLPGQATGGCTASPSGDSQNGGAAVLCTHNPGVAYPQLPTGYIYCDATAGTQGATNCGNEVSQVTPSSFTLRAESNNDRFVITCTEQGCSETREATAN